MAYGYLEISFKSNHVRLIVLIKRVIGKFDLGMGFSEYFFKEKNIFLSKVGERCCKLE